MTATFTPTLEQVRAAWWWHRGGEGAASGSGSAFSEFHDWLATHDRDVAAKALREAAAEARTRGDIGHPEGVPAEQWLMGMANRLEAS